MKVTIKQIAKEAGVSVTTVSNVINHKAHRVSDDKKKLIENLINKRGYTPNMNARALVQSSSSLIGLLYYSFQEHINFSDPFVTEILEGIEQSAKATGYFTLVHNVTSVADIEVVQRNWRFEGYIMIGVSEAFFEEVYDKLTAPVVFIDTHLPSIKYQELNHPCWFINTDDYQASYEATHYLLEKGHQKIAFLSYSFQASQTGVIQQRYAGYLHALQTQGQKPDLNLRFTRDDFEQMAVALKEYTAVIATADVLAMEFIHYLKERDLYDQKQTALISFDDIRYASLCDPPLTTIRLDQIRKGSLAMESLIEMIKDPDGDREVLQLIKGELVIRKSS